jgi:hypothetical protein
MPTAVGLALFDKFEFKNLSCGLQLFPEVEASVNASIAQSLWSVVESVEIQHSEQLDGWPFEPGQ